MTLRASHHGRKRGGGGGRRIYANYANQQHE
jgi:hypothetical protein